MALEHAPSWQNALQPEFAKPYMQQLKAFLHSEKSHKKIIYPHSAQWFHALEVTPLDTVKVVIIGQDPYHQPGQAHGLCFSVPYGVKPPPSLRNIMLALASDLACAPVSHGNLESWARQGVLLLNAVLTVEQGKANAHANQGWEIFTDRIIEVVMAHRAHVVFMLWGSYAQKKARHVDTSKHLVLNAVHPSPLSAHRGFISCGHFSQANAYLVAHGLEPIDWQLPQEPPKD